MFQRLQKNFNLDFLDNKIAEEQERQKQQTKGSSSTVRARRADGQAESPSRRSGSRLQASDARRKDVSPARRGPDPEEFAIGDDTAETSRAATPGPTMENEESVSDGKKPTEKAEGDTSAAKHTVKAEDDELPLEVRQKLAKLETLTTRYQDLLRNYRTAHAHVAAIEPFEATLREHTPLTSISDPGALVEFLNQRSLQSDMVMEELKRVSGQHTEAVKERDDLKIKLDEAEKKAKEAFDEAADLRKERDQAVGASPGPQDHNANGDPLGVSPMSGKGMSNADYAQKGAPAEDDFFSHETEVAKAEAEENEYIEKIQHLETELQESKEYINELATDLATMRQDLEMTQLDHSAMVNKVRVKDEHIKGSQGELESARTSVEQTSKDLRTARTDLQQLRANYDEAQRTTADLRGQLEKVRENVKDGENVHQEEKRLDTLQRLVNTLRAQLKTAEDHMHEANGKVNDLQLQVKLMESESNASGNLISSLRGHEDAAKSLRKRLGDAERERDDAQRFADSKKGHEHAAASLRTQLKRAEQERDSAYQMIIDCGKCDLPEKQHEGDGTRTERSISTTDKSSDTADSRSRVGSEATDSTIPTELDEETPTVAKSSGDAGELLQPGEGTKKAKKKKSKSKKKGPADGAFVPSENSIPSLEELQQNPDKIPEMLSKIKDRDNVLMPMVQNMVEVLKRRGDSQDEDQQTLLQHHEDVIEQRQQEIKDREVQLQAKAEEVVSLQEEIRKQTDAASEATQRHAQAEIVFKQQIETLQKEISGKDAKIEQLQERLKGEAELHETIDNLREECETLKEDILEHGSAATDAKHELKMLKDQKQKLQDEFDEVQRGQVASGGVERLQAELESLKSDKAALQATKDACDRQIEELQSKHTANGLASDTKHKALSEEFDKLKSKSTAIEKELAAANQLAQTRFKDLSAIRELYNKVQPELKKLRDEVVEMKSLKSDLDKSNAHVKKLEGKERDLKSEIALHKSTAGGKDAEIASLTEKAKKNAERSTALEESYETARKDLEKSEGTRDEALETRDKLQADLSRVGDELKKSKSTLDDLQKQVRKFSDESSGLRDELQIKSAQQASAQSLMDSMDNQTREMSTQMKEVRERNVSLEEELADANRMLSERSRDAETMRRMLTDAQSRAESRVKEMRDKMDLAIEERDRAEEDLSSVGRKKAREIEDIKTKLRDAERDAARAKEAREDAERKEVESRSQREDLERRAVHAQEELAAVRSTMNNLQDTLDEGERYARELEKQKADLKRSVEEKDTRLEKLQRSGKSMAEELRHLQNASKLRQQSVQSSRSSNDSARVASPVSKDRHGAALAGAAGQQPQPQSGKELIDMGYLKNILLQFLEQKDKKYQMQLVPVLGMLLHFDRQEEQKWMAAITTK